MDSLCVDLVDTLFHGYHRKRTCEDCVFCSVYESNCFHCDFIDVNFHIYNNDICGAFSAFANKV